MTQTIRHFPSNTVLRVTRNGQTLTLLAKTHWDTGNNWFKRVWPALPRGVKPDGDRLQRGDTVEVLGHADDIGLLTQLTAMGVGDKGRNVVARARSGKAQ